LARLQETARTLAAESHPQALHALSTSHLKVTR
jgi:hypothetical protein